MLVSLAYLAGAADALHELLAVGAAEGGHIERRVAGIDHELNLLGGAWECVLYGDDHLTCQSLQRKVLGRSVVGDIEGKEFAEGGLDISHGHRTICHADVRASCANERQVVVAVGEGQGDSAEVIHVARLVGKLGTAVKDVEIGQRHTIHIVKDSGVLLGSDTHRRCALLKRRDVEGHLLGRFRRVLIVARHEAAHGCQAKKCFFHCHVVFRVNNQFCPLYCRRGKGIDKKQQFQIIRLKNSHFLNLSCYSCKKIAFFFTFVSQFVNTFVPLIHQQNRHGREECSVARAFSWVHANDMLPFGAPIEVLSPRACSAVLYIFSIFAAE